MVRTVRVRYVPYAYGMKYAYGTQQLHSNNFGLKQLSIISKTFHYYGTEV